MVGAGRIAVCLVLGVVTTLAVAWAFSVSMTVPVPGGTDVMAEGFQVHPSADKWYWCQVKVRPGLTVVVWELAKKRPHPDNVPDVAIHPPTVDVRVLDPATQKWNVRVRKAPLPIDPRAVPAWARAVHLDPQLSGLTMASARGWPLRALWYEATYLSRGQDVSGGARLSASLQWIGPGEVLPCRPIAAGFAADSVLYAALWSALLFVPGRIGRVVRRLRGRCPRCAYELAHLGHERCPECGFERRAARK